MGVLGGLVSGGLGAVGGIFGAGAQNKLIKRQMRMLSEQKRENQDWYDRRYNEDPTQLASMQRMMTRVENDIKNRNRAAAGNQAVMGGTAESVAATQNANAQALADATSRIAANGERRKDQIEGRYLQRKNDIDGQMMELQGQRRSVLNDAFGGAAVGITNELG